MDYQKVYNQIVERAKKEQEFRILNRKNYYFEGHHIIPKSLNGLGKSSDWYNKDINNRNPNIVGLTAREHFICHWLLIRIYPKNAKLIRSFWMMCNHKGGITKKRYIPSSRIYNESKILYSNSRKGATLTQETKDKISVSMIGKNKGNLISVKQKEKLRLINIGKKLSKETKEKMSKSFKGRLVSNTTKEKLRNINLGKTLSIEHKTKISNSCKGKLSWNSGIKLEIVICPHCNKEGGINNMIRYHFENCKIKQ